jgi:hypothetical protein
MNNSILLGFGDIKSPKFLYLSTKLIPIYF